MFNVSSSLNDYNHAYILVKATKTVENTVYQGTAANKAGKRVIFKKCVPFVNCKSRAHNTDCSNTNV